MLTRCKKAESNHSVERMIAEFPARKWKTGLAHKSALKILLLISFSNSSLASYQL